MSHFIRKFVPHLIHSNSNRSFLVHLSSLQLQPELSLSQYTNNDSFTVKYLIHNCGFSRENAVSASKNVNFDKPDKPDACLSFLKKHGFSDTQLLKLLTKYPTIIVSDLEKTLLPKIQFLHSIGFVETDITALLVAEPTILGRSLEGCLEPIFDLLEDHLGSVEDARKAIKSCPGILLVSKTHVLEQNIQVLKEAGVPIRRITPALRSQPLVFACSCRKMQEVVKDVMKMGFQRRSLEFMSAVCSMGSLSKLEWKKKLELFQRWDCSEEEVLSAFKREPKFMKVPEEKIDAAMDFFVNEMGWKPQTVLLTPQLFTYSLQMKIVPRCSVVKHLLSKGLLKVKCNLYTAVKYSEDIFFEKFINCYPEEAPELLRLYEEKMKNSVDKFL